MVTTWFTVLVLGCGLSLCAATCNHGTIVAAVSPQEAQAIVDKHNELRQMIMDGTVEGQPKGVNLNPLQWDESLASAAQDITNTCAYGHVDVHDPRFSVGQNIAWRAFSAPGGDPGWDYVIQNMWFGEYKSYHYPDNPGDNTVHYTQVVWANTKFVGCGYTHYQEDRTDFPYEKFYVCNYGPAGNVDGQPPYQTA